MKSLDDAEALLTAPGQLFEMDEVEIRGVRTRVWKHAPPSLRSILEITRLHGDATFLVYEDDRMTFEQHFRQAAAFARRLTERHGVRKGDRVAIVMRNFPEWSVAFFGAAAIGAVGASQRLVDRLRAGIRPARQRREGAGRRRGASRPPRRCTARTRGRHRRRAEHRHAPGGRRGV
jgi:non-ribosomal peptide synthetase component F